MLRTLLILFFAVLGITRSFAQNRSVSGNLTDRNSKFPLTGASVYLKSLTDSTTLTSLSDSTGNFTFTNLTKDSFLLTVTFISYSKVSRKIIVDTTDLTVDISLVADSSSDLETVVIRTSITPVSQKGDTLQINANQFKVNPDASGEDLIRKVPGVTIENGQVKAQGENVQKVTIDGRELFGDDATAALRNLPAEIVDKIQIFDRLSDQAQFSGFDDGNTTKSINIVTKANMRNGQFGRLFAGYGTDERYSAGGNATFLKNNRRISLIGNFNNINQQSFSQQDLLGVTSNAQRGGGGGGTRGGGGGPAGGSGNRGGGGGNQGGGNYGGFGNSGNFFVGQQDGINRTNSAGFNYTDLWGKTKNVTMTGSYLYSNTNNRTNEIANQDYFAGNIDVVRDTTLSNSRNNNHRVNVRFEYRIDSANQLIITPNLSFQENQSFRDVSSLIQYASNNFTQQRLTRNTTSSSRSGNNLNNTILFRHAFPKRGRTFSINLNTSYNKRDGESYVRSLSSVVSSITSSDTSDRFTNQTSDGYQLSTNISYTEPLSQNAQLQVNYNPSFSRSEADYQAFNYNPALNKYSEFLPDFSNQSETKTKAQNAGLSYRYGNRDRQISFGANYQYTNLESDRIYPIKTSVDKSFSNILPNAQVRYKVSARSSFRIFYRSNVNQPSVTQLQDVVDPVNAPIYTVGNPNLDQQYTSTVSTQYTFTNTTKGLLVVGNVYYQSAKDYIATASYNSSRGGDTVVNGARLDSGFRLTKPINLDGFNSLRSFVTFAIPLKFIKSNFNLNGGVTLSHIPGQIDYINNETKNTTFTLGAVIASNVSQYVDFTVSYSANLSRVKSTVTSSDKYFQQVASVQMNLLTKTGWFYQTDANAQFYKGLASGFNQNYYLWNMGVGKKFLKDNKGELKLTVFDLLKENQSITRNVTGLYIEDVQRQVLTRYFLVTFTYNLRNFGTAPARNFNRMGGGGMR